MKEKMIKAVTRQFRVIFPYALNDHDSLFGGNALKWMNEVAYITATRFTRMKMVTVTTGEARFRNAIRSGTIAEIRGRVIKVGSIKIDIKVEIFVEEMYSESRFKAVDAIFTFVAVDNNNMPVRLNLGEIEYQQG